MSLDALNEMAHAIREVIQRYGANLREISDSDLRDLAMIVSAFASDLYREVERRDRPI